MNQSNRFPTAPTAAQQYEAPPEKSTIELCFDRFIKEKRYLCNLSERTLLFYRQVFDRWLKYAGRVMPDTESLGVFIICQREAGLSPATCNVSVRTFNPFLTWLHENGYTDKLRLRLVKSAKKVMKTFTDQQFELAA